MDWSIAGSFKTIEKTQEAVLHLREKGYPKDVITIFCNERQAPTLADLEVTVETGLAPLEEEQDGFWDKAKIFFEDDDISSKDMTYYRDELAKGNMVVAYHDNPTYIENTPVTNEEIILDRPLDISEISELAKNQDTGYSIE